MNCLGSCSTLDEEKVPNRGIPATHFPNSSIRVAPAPNFPNASLPRITYKDKVRFRKEEEEKFERDYPSVSLAIHTRPFHSYSKEMLSYFNNRTLGQTAKEFSPLIFNDFVKKHLEKVPAR